MSTTILKLLNQGESVHFMERAIHNGDLGPKRGRTDDQLAAISGALSLIANILMTWNTLHIEEARAAEPQLLNDDVISKVAPVAHGLFNLRGMFNFDLGTHRSALLKPIRNVIIPRAKTWFLKNFNELVLEKFDFVNKFNGLLIVTFCTNQPRTPQQPGSLFSTCLAPLPISNGG